MPPRHPFRSLILFLASCVLTALIGVAFSAPAHFPVGAVVTVAQGEPASEVAAAFRNAGAVRSSHAFLLAIGIFDGLRGQEIKAGDYSLSRPFSAFLLAVRLGDGTFGFSKIKVTLPEGFTAKQMAATLAPLLPHFDTAAFLSLAVPKEGYLFPSTYFFTANDDATSTFTELTNTFDEQIATIQDKITAFGKPLSDVVTMASILEEEARTPEDRRIVAGILWKRIGLGMALQVDSSLRYSTGKTSAELTATDLKTDSPYNTYTRRGLPPTPISNPGIESLTDAITPTTTDYLYFLTGSDGTMHYATTLEGHLENEQRYLK